MNKKLKKCTVLTLSAFACAGIAAGILVQTNVSTRGVSGANQANTETSILKLDTSVTNGTNSAYATLGTATDKDGNTWKCEGNLTLKPWKLGGKSLTSVTERKVYKVGTFSQTISKINVEIGTSEVSTFDFVKLYVCANNSGEPGDVAYTLTKSSPVVSSTITFEPETEQDWSNKIFKITFGLTVTGDKNKGVQLKSIEYFTNQTLQEPDSIEVSGEEIVNISESQQYTAVCKKDDSSEGVNQNVVWSVEPANSGIISNAGVYTALRPGSATIKATAQNVSTVVGTFGVTVPNTPYVPGTKTLNVNSLDLTGTYISNKYSIIDGLVLYGNNVCKRNESTSMQFKKNEGFIRNAVEFPYPIKSITVNKSDSYVNFAIGVGTSYDNLEDATISEEQAASHSFTLEFDESDALTYFNFYANNTKYLAYVDDIIIETYSGTETPEYTEAKNAAKAVYDGVAESCAAGFVSEEIWEALKAAFEETGASDAAKYILKHTKYGVDPTVELEVSLERYDYIVSKYGYENFFDRNIESSSNYVSSLSMNSANIAIIIAIASILTVSATAAILISKKKKATK